MSSYGSAHSGQLHPGYQPQPPQQRIRSHSNPPYPTTPGAAPYPQQQSSYFPPPPTAPYGQAPPTSNPIAIPPSKQRRSSDYAYGYGTSPSYPPPSSSYSPSYPAQPLQPIPQQQPIPENYQYSPQQGPAVMATSPSHSHPRRRSSSSQYGYDPRASYESAHSYHSTHSHQTHPSPDFYARHAQNGQGNYDDRYNYGNENEGQGAAGSYAVQAPPAGYAAAAAAAAAAPAQHPPPHTALPLKGYGDWDKHEVSKYHKNQDLERRPTLGGSLMSLVKKMGGSERR